MGQLTNEDAQKWLDGLSTFEMRGQLPRGIDVLGMNANEDLCLYLVTYTPSSWDWQHGSPILFGGIKTYLHVPYFNDRPNYFYDNENPPIPIVRPQYGKPSEDEGFWCWAWNADSEEEVTGCVNWILDFLVQYITKEECNAPLCLQVPEIVETSELSFWV